MLALPAWLEPSWYSGKQAYRYPALLALFAQEFSAGQYYPRWLSSLTGGYGWPTFVYYPPLFWFLALPLAPLGTVIACKVILTGSALSLTFGCYWLARKFTGHKAACLATILTLSTPALLASVYRRGDLAEFLALSIGPWLLYHALRLTQDHARASYHSAWLGILAAMMLISHPMTAIWIALGAAIILMPSLKTLWQHLLAAFLLAASISSAYWFPMLQWGSAADLSTGMTPATRAGIPPVQLFSPMAGYLGLLALPLSLYGFWQTSSPKLRQLRWLHLILLPYLLPLSNSLRDAIPLLHYLQWPSRSIMLITLMQCMAMAASLGVILEWPRENRQPLLAALIALALWQTSIHARTAIPQNAEEYQAKLAASMEDLTHFHEFRPIHAKPTELTPAGGLIETPQPGITATAPKSASRLSITTTGSETKITINQFAFPGWQLHIGDKTVSTCQPTPPSLCHDALGRIVIHIPQGNTQVQLNFEPPPYANLRNAISALIASACFVLLRYIGRHSRLPEASRTT